MNCPNCNSENPEGTKYCMNCGKPMPQTKNCPRCNTVVPFNAKFCQSCGYDFSGEKAAAGLIGDKNVIAGDVTTTINHNEVYNTTTNNITNNTIIDETKKTDKCHVCGKVIPVVDGFTCPECGRFTCSDCFVIETRLCKNCNLKIIMRYEGEYEKRVKELIGDNKITKELIDNCIMIATELKVTIARAYEILDKIYDDGLVEAEYGWHLVQQPGKSDEGLIWIQRSCEKGCKWGAYYCGKLAKVSKCFETAFNNFSYAADEIDDAAYELAEMLASGTGCNMDDKKAVEILKTLADKGHSLAQMSLGALYMMGKGVEKDYSNAFKFFKMSAEQGNAQAQLMLAQCYALGQGCNVDYQLAFNWANSSKANGCKEAGQFIENMKKNGWLNNL